MISVIRIANRLATPPTAPLLGGILALYVFGCVCAFGVQLPSAVTMPCVTGFFRIVFTPAPYANSLFIAIIPIPPLPLLGYAFLIGFIPALMILFMSLGVIFFPPTFIFAILVFVSLLVGGGLGQSFFSVLFVPLLASNALFFWIVGVIKALCLSVLIPVFITPLLFVFSTLFYVIFVVLFVLFQHLLPIFGIVFSGSRSQARFTFIPQLSRFIAYPKVFRGSLELLTAFCTTLKGNVVHSVSLSPYLKVVSADGEIDRRFGCTSLADSMNYTRMKAYSQGGMACFSENG